MEQCWLSRITGRIGTLVQAVSFALVFASPLPAAGLQPYTAKEIKPYTALEIKEHREKEVQKYQGPSDTPGSAAASAVSEGCFGNTEETGAPVSLTVEASSRKTMKIEVVCRKDLDCKISSAWRFPSVEVKGRCPDAAGYNVTMEVTDRTNNKPMAERNVGVDVQGRFNTSFNVTNYASGDYRILLRSGDGRDSTGGIVRITEPADSDAGKSQGNIEPSTFLGTWYGSNVVSSFTVHADGTYSSRNGARGSYRTSGEGIQFTSGPLTAWDKGRATLNRKNGSLEFIWTTAQGSKLYYGFFKK